MRARCDTMQSSKDDEYISTKTARKILGVTTPTLSRWAKTGKVGFIKSPSNTRLYCAQDIYNIAGRSTPTAEKRKICYCRVSSRKQMDDLERQCNFFLREYPGYEVVHDVASGINWKRKSLQTILEQAMLGNVQEVVVAHRDRLCRFGFELIEYIFEKCKVKLTVLHGMSGESSESDLAEDIVSIIHVYSCRNMGRRRYKVQKDKDLPLEAPKDSLQEMDGN